MRLRLWLMVMIILVGCAPVPEGAVASYRDSSVMISSTLRFDLARFEGDWVVRAAYPSADFLQRVRVQAVSAEAFVWRADGTPRKGVVTGPGRFRLEGQAQEYWVLWVDEGFRTAAIGTPDGSFGYLLDRKQQGGTDRMIAASKMFEFNGYDMTRLEPRE